DGRAARMPVPTRRSRRSARILRGTPRLRWKWVKLRIPLKASRKINSDQRSPIRSTDLAPGLHACRLERRMPARRRHQPGGVVVLGGDPQAIRLLLTWAPACAGATAALGDSVLLG